MNTTLTTTATMPTGEKVVMSHDPKVYQAGTHAWLTEEQAAFQMAGLAVWLMEGKVLPAANDKGDFGFVLTDPDTGQPTKAVVFAVYADGTAESMLPTNEDELMAGVWHGTDGSTLVLSKEADQAPAEDGHEACV